MDQKKKKFTKETTNTKKESESEVTQSCPTLCDPMDVVAYEASTSVGFSRQEYWSGLPFPSPEDLPNPRIQPRSPALQTDTLPSEPPGKPLTNTKRSHKIRIQLNSLLKEWKTW